MDVKTIVEKVKKPIAQKEVQIVIKEMILVGAEDVTKQKNKDYKSMYSPHQGEEEHTEMEK